MNILIIGLHKFQLEKIRKANPSHSISGLCSQDKHNSKVKGTYDYVISITKFTNHSTEDHYSKHKGFLRICGGGSYSSVKNLVYKLINESKEVAYG